MTTGASETLERSIPSERAPWSLKTGEIPGMDGMRAIAVSVVMLGHYGLGKYVPGGFGVTLFFFISGFLITVLMLREHAESGKISISRFYIRRLLRLQPELVFFLVASGVIGTLVSSRNTPSGLDIAGAVLYISNYVTLLQSEALRWPQLWSLAVEEHFYLIYPAAFVFFFRKGGNLLQALTILCGIELLWRCVLLWGHAPAQWTYMATDARLDSIAYGCAAALILWRGGKLSSPGDRASAGLIGAGLALIVATLVVKSEFFRESFRYSVQGIGLALFVAGALTPAGRRWIAFLDRPAMQWAGRMSYAAYLWHLEPLWIAKETFGAGAVSGPAGASAMIVVGFALTFGIAAASHRFIYLPFLPLRRRFGSHAS